MQAAVRLCFPLFEHSARAEGAPPYRRMSGRVFCNLGGTTELLRPILGEETLFLLKNFFKEIE